MSHSHVTDALGFLHDLDLSHGSLWPRNVLLTSGRKVKLADYCRDERVILKMLTVQHAQIEAAQDASGDSPMDDGRIGDLWRGPFTEPELFFDNTVWSSIAADVYSLGCIIARIRPS